MNASELRQKSVEELKQMSSELRAQLFDLRFKLFTNQSVRSSDVRTTRRQIARVETVLREQLSVSNT